MELYYNLLIIIFSIVFIIDYSGFVTSLSKFIYETLNKTPWVGQMLPKPFSCSLCMVFWVVLIYLIYCNVDFVHVLGLASLSSFLTILVNKILGIIIRFIHKI